jgi:hypothetical protein
LGTCRQSDILADIREHWTEKCFCIVSVRPANRCSDSCHQQRNEGAIKRNPTPITAAFTSVIITSEFHFKPAVRQHRPGDNAALAQKTQYFLNFFFNDS